ncbi:MAG: hypothetical protein HQ507_06955 [Candidatus Marinimicrobia bacterium]|nr:hypothetical protein [Candidatus Neomarinimicrobiota bacterium]
MRIDRVSDELILKEYVRRFTIPAGESIRSAREVARHCRGFFSEASKKEKFLAVYLNSQHQLLSTEILFEGSLTTSAVYPREVITRVLDVNSAAIIVAHNHPSGNTKP